MKKVKGTNSGKPHTLSEAQDDIQSHTFNDGSRHMSQSVFNIAARIWCHYSQAKDRANSKLEKFIGNHEGLAPMWVMLLWNL